MESPGIDTVSFSPSMGNTAVSPVSFDLTLTILHSTADSGLAWPIAAQTIIGNSFSDYISRNEPANVIAGGLGPWDDFLDGRADYDTAFSRSNVSAMTVNLSPVAT